MQIHRYPSGEQCWTWRIPEKWTCQEAYLETLDGKRLIDYADHPLHVISYSLPFEGVVSRAELMNHLHVHPRLPEAIPFVFKYYERNWGLCCSQTLRDHLNDEQYRVVIRTRFEPVAGGDGSWRLDIRAPDKLGRYLAPKGSIAVNGVSLTVNRVQDTEFSINLIPHTLEQTMLKYLKPGSRVNLEADMLARYADRLLNYIHEQDKN